MINFRKTYRILAGVTLFGSSYGMYDLGVSDEDNALLPHLIVRSNDLGFLSNSSPSKFFLKGKSRNKNIQAGGVKKGLGIYPVLKVDQNTQISLSNHKGVALGTVDSGEVAVGYIIFSEGSEKKDCPAIWVKRSDGQYNQFLVENTEGRYNCIDETGTWVAGRHKIENIEHAVVSRIGIKEFHDLGPGRIFEMTWDGTVFCGIKVVGGKEYACLWERGADDQFKETYIQESKGLDESTLSLDLEDGDFITYEKEGRSYKWSKAYGVVSFVN